MKLGRELHHSVLLLIIGQRGSVEDAFIEYLYLVRCRFCRLLRRAKYMSVLKTMGDCAAVEL